MRLIWPAAAIALAVGLGACGARSASGPRLGIAFVRGAAGTVPQVWLAGADGRGARPLGPGRQPLIAPAGSLVAASSSARTGPALLVYSADGGRPRAFFDAARVSASPLAWSSDSRYLAVALNSTDPLSDHGSGLAVVDMRSLAYRIAASGVIYGASFAPDGSDRLAYASAPTAALAAPVDVHVTGTPTGRPVQGAITRDGRSLYPVWGRRAIAFAHETLRRGAAPVYQLWTMRPDGSRLVALTHVPVPPLIDGLIPLSYADDGGWLLAEYEGQDTSQAWAVPAGAGQPRALHVDGRPVTGSALSRSGSTALVNVDGFLNPPDQGVVEVVPLRGGPPRVVVLHGSEPTWNL